MTKSRGLRNTKDRAAAKAAGEKYYVSWVPCKRGHMAKRLTSNGSCLACLALIKSEKDKAYYARNADKVKTKVRKYRDQNREVVAARDKEKWIRNREKNIDLCRVRSSRHTAKRRLDREYDAYLSRVENEEADV